MSAFLIIIGMGATAIALAADLIGIGGHPGFGSRQIVLVFLGLGSLMAGIILAIASHPRYPKKLLSLPMVFVSLIVVGGILIFSKL